MAKLFLSYSRKDEARARRFTKWLEHEGHDVWRDEDDIGGGASFSSEIERALKDSDAVLVLWSADSVQSAWVRDEAAYGRDHGKLIPFSLDQVEPPLGFRQFQIVSLSAWKGHGEPPHADRVRSAIARLADLPQAATAAAPPNALAGKPSRRWALIGALVVVVALALFGLFLWQRVSNEQQVAIAVLPSPQSSDRAMAADYANAAAADMAAFLPRRFDRAIVIAPADATDGRAAYRMEISTDPHGPSANASLTLLGDSGTVLWSKNWSVADAATADLKAEVSEFASKAALCLTEARGGGKRLSQPALGLFLTGCAGFVDTKLSDEDVQTIFERVTKLYPDFGPAWDYLALNRSWIAQGLQDSSPTAHAAAVQRAREAIAKARKLNPNSAMSYDAEYQLIPNDTSFSGLRVLEKGAEIDPDDGLIQMDLSNEFLRVGRLSDAVEAAQRGVELEPSTPYSRSQYIQALVYSGKFSKAKADIAEARKKWPNDPAIDNADFGLQFRYGDARAALELLPRIMNSSDAALVPYRKVIAARLDPSPTKVDDAIAALKAQPSSNPVDRNRVLLALGNFGRAEQVYEMLEDPTFQPFIASDVLFRPDFAGVRADPRFMQIAARLGLVRYWRQSGYWPDFCTSEKLRYDCKSEAAKYPN